MAKPSKPSRAYVHVTQQTFVAALGDRVRSVSFHDAAKSFQDTALVGPPVLEFAPYAKLPSNRKRNDARQGTIDQDPEFKEFLESLTAPIPKPALPDTDMQKEEKIKTTPLIEALREKKANKDKPQKKGRGEHKDDSGEKKILAKPGKENTLGDKGRKAARAEKERAQKEAARALNKEAPALKETTVGDKAAAGLATAVPERKRANVNIAKGILQRDLGLGPAPNRRRGTKREIAPAAAQESILKQEENASSKQKGKETAPAPVAAAVVVPSEKTVSTLPKKERPSRTMLWTRLFNHGQFILNLFNLQRQRVPISSTRAQCNPFVPPARSMVSVRFGGNRHELGNGRIGIESRSASPWNWRKG